MSTTNGFRKAQRSKVWLKLAIQGLPGAGKTYSALLLAKGLSFKRVAIIDTENGSGELYSDLYDYDYMRLDPPFKPINLVNAIRSAIDAGYDCIVIDSFSHFWKYILEYKDTLDNNPKANKWGNWGRVKPLYDEAKAAILHSPCHVVCCLRSKADYIQVGSGDTSRIQKQGTAPITEPENEYEFTTVFDVERTHQSTAAKDRTGLFIDRAPFMISEHTGLELISWLGDGEYQIPDQWEKIGSAEAAEAQKEAERLRVGEDRPASSNGAFAKLTDEQKASIYTYLEKLGISGEAALGELKSACLTAGKPMLHFALECQQAGITTAEALFAKLSPAAGSQSPGTSNGALPDSTEAAPASPGSSSAGEALPTITAADFNLSPGEIAKTRTLAKSLGKSPPELYSLSYLGGARDFSGIESWVSAQLKAVSK